MNSLARPTVRIRQFRPNRGRTKFRISNGAGYTIELDCQLDIRLLSTLRSELVGHLDACSQQIGTEVWCGRDPELILRSLLRLQRHGADIVKRIFYSSGRLDEFMNFLRSELPSIQHTDHHEIDWSIPYPSRTLPLVEIASPHDCVFPWECLPLLRFDDQTENPSVLSIVRSYLGFATIVRRVFTDSPVYKKSRYIDVHQRPLAVRFYRHTILDGAMRERNFLRQLPHVRLFEAWPKLKENANAGDNLSVQIKNQMRRPSESRDHFHHFAIHCGASLEPGEVALRFSENDEDSVTVGSLGASTDIKGSKNNRFGIGPIVFINACGSGRVITTGVSTQFSSFPHYFLSKGCPACIATETKVPDRFASAFSKRFYALFMKGLTVGEALLAARWYFLRKNCNPLGMLYTLAGESSLRVSMPNSWIHLQ